MKFTHVAITKSRKKKNNLKKNLSAYIELIYDTMKIGWKTDSESFTSPFSSTMNTLI